MRKKSFRYLLLVGSLIILFLSIKDRFSFDAVSRGLASNENYLVKEEASAAKHHDQENLDSSKLSTSSNNPEKTKPVYETSVQNEEAFLQAKRLFCMAKQAKSSVPIDGKVRVSFSELGERGEFGSYAIISSLSCPPDTYSMVKFSSDRQIEKQIDCRRTNLVELSLELQRQWGINEKVSVGNQVHLALAGPGYFPLFCPSKGFKLSRAGNFHINSKGVLVDNEACVVWGMPTDENPQGGPFVGEEASQILEEGFDEMGCLTSGRCVGAIDPLIQDKSKLKFKNSVSMWAELDLEKIRPIPVTKVYSDALEDLDNPLRSKTGWEHPDHWFQFDQNVNCE